MEQQPETREGQELWQIGIFDTNNSTDPNDAIPVVFLPQAQQIAGWVGMAVVEDVDAIAGVWLAMILSEDLAQQLEDGLDVAITIEIGQESFLITIATSN